MDTQIAQTRVYYRFEEIDGEADTERQLEMAPASPCLSILHSENVQPGFWKRQFGDDLTSRQPKWDWAFGVVMPLVCFYFDPFVFREWSGGEGVLLPRFQLPVYVFAYASIMALAAWLLWGDKLGMLRLPVACVMVAGAILASLLGVVLFPFSLLGLLAIIGVLGFTPIFTAVTFWRNAVRAFRSAGRSSE